MWGLLWWAWTCVCAHAGLPVESVHYSVTVHGPLAEVVVEQVFVNDTDDFIEGVYVFPLHEQGAVDAMRIEVAGAVIEGEIQELQQARATYTEAVEQGHVAALTTQEQANVFRQQVGNLPPGERVHVWLRVIQPVPFVNDAYELTLPLVVAPRFTAPELGEESVPGPLTFAEGSATRATIDAEVISALPFTRFASPSHALDIEVAEDRAYVRSAEVPLDKDFVMRWAVSSDRPTASAIVQDGHAVLSFESPIAPPREHIVSRELIWVIDQSCSMTGQPIELVRAAMLEALQHVDHRDSWRILQFSDKVRGDAHKWAATPDNIARADEQIRALQTSGGTYLLDGVLAALDTPRDPTRDRYVVFLTDALIGQPRGVLSSIADRVGDARVFAFGVGASPNRWLLDEMASIGGGTSTWLRDGEDPTEAVRRFDDTLSRPVLTDIVIDWGDWEVDDVWPGRLPTLMAGQPTLATARISAVGTEPIVIRGRLGDGPFEQRITPIMAGEGRAIPSTWARQAIRHLQREQLWGDNEEVIDTIRELSLEYQVLSEYTAFVAVDKTRVVNPGGSQESVEQPAEMPDGMEMVVKAPSGGGREEVVVTAARKAVDVESTSRSVVVTREFLSKIPAGRSYQTAVTFAAGVQAGALGTPNMGGGAFNENTYMVDGINITDPVTGTFSLNFNYDSIRRLEVIRGGMMPEYSSAGSVVNLITQNGTNNLAVAATASHLQGVTTPSGLSAQQLASRVSGPVIRDKAWIIGSVQGDRTTYADRDYLGGNGLLKLTVQPNTNNRYTVTALGDTARIDSDTGPVTQSSGVANGRWQWFMSPENSLDTVVSAQSSRVGGDQRTRLLASSKLSLLSVDDPLGGTHDLKLGAAFESIGWQLRDQALAVFGPTVPATSRTSWFSAFLQDSWRLRPDLTVNAGARVDVALGRTIVSPRASVAWDPWDNDKTKLALGYGHYVGHLALPTLHVEPEAGPSEVDEVLVIAERELVTDLALYWSGTRRMRSNVPTFLGGRVDRSAWISDLGLRKIHSRRWAAELAWRRTWLFDPADADVIDDGAVEAFGHQLTGMATWSLPTDPWTQHLSGMLAWYADPLGTVGPDPLRPRLPNVARWRASVLLSQEVDLRKGALTFTAEGSYLSPTPDQRDLNALVGYQPPLLELVGWEGWRVRGELRYAF
ncbi:MAG: TonB-dependent receptor [Myxococcales bacterium]|nr:TonB-dependent receptor [Myxococcales bacterium]